MPFAIPPLMVLTLGVIGAMAAGRWLAQEARRINAELRPERSAEADERAIPAVKLRRDPNTGIYRPD